MRFCQCQQCAVAKKWLNLKQDLRDVESDHALEFEMLGSCGDGSVVRVENRPRCLTSCTFLRRNYPSIFPGRNIWQRWFQNWHGCTKVKVIVARCLETLCHLGVRRFYSWPKCLMLTICMHSTKHVIHLYCAWRAAWGWNLSQHCDIVTWLTDNDAQSHSHIQALWSH